MKAPVLTLLATSVSFTVLASTDIPIKTNSPLVETDSPIMFAYHDKDRTLAELNLATNQFASLVVPEEAYGFDYGKLANSESVTAIVMTKDGIFAVGKTTSEKLLPINSLLSKIEPSKFQKIKFVSDINKDGLSDILLPDLTHSSIYLQNPDKTFTEHKFDTSPNYSGSFNDGNLTINIDLTLVPEVFDVNQDGLYDLIFQNNEEINILYATKQGFSPSPTSLDIPVKLGKFEQEKAKRKIALLQDINDDGMLDLVTQYSPILSGFDALDAEITYQIYWGEPGGKFSQSPQNLPKASGATQLAFKHDFNGDGKNDLQKSFIDFGFGTLTSMALGNGSAEVDVEISFHRQLADGTFNSAPDAEQEVEMELKMDGEDMALTYYTGDVNGDGKQDAIFKTGSKTLKIYYGNETTLLEKKAKKIKHTLPESANDIKLVDVNNDGKQDFVFRFKDKNGNSSIKTVLN